MKKIFGSIFILCVAMVSYVAIATFLFLPSFDSNDIDSIEIIGNLNAVSAKNSDYINIDPNRTYKSMVEKAELALLINGSVQRRSLIRSVRREAQCDFSLDFLNDFYIRIIFKSGNSWFARIYSNPYSETLIVPEGSRYVYAGNCDIASYLLSFMALNSGCFEDRSYSRAENLRSDQPLP